MKKIFFLLLCLQFISCGEDQDVITSPVDISSCFSPELGTTESEQFLFNAQIGELIVNLDNLITTQNVGYSISEGSKTVFIYRHILENDFNIDDDEVEKRILFQIDGNLDSFEIDNTEDFEKSNLIYAECGIALQTVTGKIKGVKISNGNWSVIADLQVQRFTKSITITINEIFEF